MLEPWLWGQWPLDLVLPQFGVTSLCRGAPSGVSSHRRPACQGSSLPRGRLTLKGLGMLPPAFPGWQGPQDPPFEGFLWRRSLGMAGLADETA